MGLCSKTAAKNLGGSSEKGREPPEGEGGKMGDKNFINGAQVLTYCHGRSMSGPKGSLGVEGSEKVSRLKKEVCEVGKDSGWKNKNKQEG